MLMLHTLWQWFPGSSQQEHVLHTSWRARTTSDEQSCSSTHTHARTLHSPFSGIIWVSQEQKGKTNLDFTEARDSEWQWHQLGHMQVCTSLQTDNHVSTPPLSFLLAGCPSCCPTNSDKALKLLAMKENNNNNNYKSYSAHERSGESVALFMFLNLQDLHYDGYYKVHARARAHARMHARTHARTHTHTHNHLRSFVRDYLGGL